MNTRYSHYLLSLEQSLFFKHYNSVIRSTLRTLRLEHYAKLTRGDLMK